MIFTAVYIIFNFVYLWGTSWKHNIDISRHKEVMADVLAAVYLYSRHKATLALNGDVFPIESTVQ